tara:strand:- start:904 stop:1239 length:336 start_codon:yes stop_codon:yes gene_type:complete
METINKADNRTWENPYKVKEDIQNWIIDVAEEINIINYNSGYESIYEKVDSSEYVIYNYQAKRVSEVYEIDPFSKSELTGENYTSFNAIAYEVLVDMLTEYITKNYPEVEL